MTAKQTLFYIFKQFQNANIRLNEAISLLYEDEIKRDAVIKRFEFTYEVLWKLLKRIAEQKQMECFSPRLAFQAAFKMELIDDEQLFVDIIEARNRTSHVYSEEGAEKIYKFIKDKVIAAFNKTEKRIEEYANPKNYKKKEKNHERKNH